MYRDINGEFIIATAAVASDVLVSSQGSYDAWLAAAAVSSACDGFVPIGDIVAVCILIIGACICFSEVPDLSSNSESGKKKTKEVPEDVPDVEYPGDDPTKPPSNDYEWKGNPPKGGPEGSWVNNKTSEQLHPDLNHKPPIGPHWDYTDHLGRIWRIFKNGKIEFRNWK